MSLDHFYNQFNHLQHHGNHLIAVHEGQLHAVVGLAQKQPAIAADIAKLIYAFENHEVMKIPNQEMEIVKKVENGYAEISANLQNIANNEKAITGTIQANHALFAESQRHLNVANGEIYNINVKIGASHQQIHNTNVAIEATNADIRHNDWEVATAVKKVKRKRKQRLGWIIAAVVSLGALTPAAINADNAVKAAKQVRQDRYDMVHQLQNTLNIQQNALNNEIAHKTGLEHTKKDLEAKAHNVADQNNRLMNAQGNLIKYRAFLLDLGDSFQEVNSCIERIKKNLQIVLEVQDQIKDDENFTLPSSVVDNLNAAYTQLKISWTGIQQRPALKISLTQIPREGAFSYVNQQILNANIHPRLRRSLETLLYSTKEFKKIEEKSHKKSLTPILVETTIIPVEHQQIVMLLNS